MERSNKTRVKSFRVAFYGLKHAAITQANFQIQLLIGLIAVLGAYYFQFDRFEWLILILTITLVLVGELLNTVVEVVVDLAVQERLLPEAKIAKDVSAAAVLLLSLVSVIVGLILFLPHIIQ